LANNNLKLLVLIEIKDILVAGTEFLEHSIFEKYKLCFDIKEILDQISEWRNDIRIELGKYFSKKEILLIDVGGRRGRKRLWQRYSFKLWINDYDDVDEQHTIIFKKISCSGIQEIFNMFESWRFEFANFLNNYVKKIGMK
jgi:hypothetical protein